MILSLATEKCHKLWLLAILIFTILIALMAPSHHAVAAPEIRCDELGIGRVQDCQAQGTVPPTEGLPPGAVNVSQPVVPYWLWYRAFCGVPRDGLVPCDSEAGRDLVVATCNRDGQRGTWMALWRQDYLPPREPYVVQGNLCVPSIDDLTPPDRPDPIVYLTDIDFYALAKSPILIEPFPNTLIRYPNNIYTKRADQNFTLNLLGRTVLVTVHPVRYHWDYGDGTTQELNGPGGPLRPEQIGKETMSSHTYQKTGSYPVSLTTFYTASTAWRVAQPGRSSVKVR